jgi:hypothetical protein
MGIEAELRKAIFVRYDMLKDSNLYGIETLVCYSKKYLRSNFSNSFLRSEANRCPKFIETADRKLFVPEA